MLPTNVCGSCLQIGVRLVKERNSHFSSAERVDGIEVSAQVSNVWCSLRKGCENQHRENWKIVITTSKFALYFPYSDVSFERDWRLKTRLDKGLDCIKGYMKIGCRKIDWKKIQRRIFIVWKLVASENISHKIWMLWKFVPRKFIT